MNLRFRTFKKPEKTKPDPEELKRNLYQLHEKRTGYSDELGQSVKLLYFDSGVSKMDFDGEVIGAPRQGGPETIGEWIGDKATDIALGLVLSTFSGFLPQILAPVFITRDIAGITSTSFQMARIRRQLRKMGENDELPQTPEATSDFY